MAVHVEQFIVGVLHTCVATYVHMHFPWYICVHRFQDLRTQKSKLAQLVKEREEEIG